MVKPRKRKPQAIAPYVSDFPVLKWADRCGKHLHHEERVAWLNENVPEFLHEQTLAISYYTLWKVIHDLPSKAERRAAIDEIPDPMYRRMVENFILHWWNKVHKM
jgi:hypothetical protein